MQSAKIIWSSRNQCLQRKEKRREGKVIAISFLLMLLLHSSVYIVKFYITEFVLLCYRISKLVILVSSFLNIKSRNIIPSRSGFLKRNLAGLAIFLLIMLAICTSVSAYFASASCTPVSVVLSSVSTVSFSGPSKTPYPQGVGL